MKLATWNIRQGGGKRAPQVLEALAAVALDAVVLTEFRQGLLHQTTGASRPRQNSVLFASRRPFKPHPVPPLPAGHEHRYIVADLGSLVIFGLYFPQKEEKASLFDWLLELPEAMRGTRTLLLGDFNTGLHRLDEEGATFSCEDRFRRLLKQGWVDDWRERNLAQREFSWFSSAGNGFRIDNALALPALAGAVRSVVYSHEERFQRVSDHSIMLLEIE